MHWCAIERRFRGGYRDNCRHCESSAQVQLGRSMRALKLYSALAIRIVEQQQVVAPAAEFLAAHAPCARSNTKRSLSRSVTPPGVGKIWPSPCPLYSAPTITGRSISPSMNFTCTSWPIRGRNWLPMPPPAEPEQFGQPVLCRHRQVVHTDTGDADQREIGRGVAIRLHRDVVDGNPRAGPQGTDRRPPLPYKTKRFVPLHPQFAIAPCLACAGVGILARTIEAFDGLCVLAANRKLARYVDAD
jgi:hypothetical protein